MKIDASMVRFARKYGVSPMSVARYLARTDLDALKDCGKDAYIYIPKPRPQPDQPEGEG